MPDKTFISRDRPATPHELEARSPAGGKDTVAKELGRVLKASGETDLSARPEKAKEETRCVHLKTGSYLIRYLPAKPTPEVASFDGTLRISREKEDGTLIEADEDNGDPAQAPVIKGSADLYERSMRPEEAAKFEKLYAKFKENYARNNEAIPSFPRSAYRFHLAGLQVLEGVPAARNVTAHFRVHRYDPDSRSFVTMGNRVCILYQIDFEELENNDIDDPRPPEFENCEEYYGGRIIDEDSGMVVGKVRVGRISDKLRKAEVEIDCVQADADKVSDPKKTGSASLEKDWADAFKGTGWEVKATVSNRNVAKPVANEGDPERPDGAWTLTELHQAMIQWHDRKDLDAAWHYYVLCVPRLVDFERGVMFDAGGTDGESDVPHDVVGVAADWPFPNHKPFLNVARRPLKKTDAYFRIAVHELGHAMGLDHNFSDNGFMNTTDVIANNAKHKHPFPKNIRMAFHPLDQARLRHEPDVRVRADTSFAGKNIIGADAREGKSVDGLRLNLAPHLEAVPYGAPVRIQFHLENTSDKPIWIPENLSLKAGNVQGSVVDPVGRIRTFSPIVWRMDDEQFKELKGKERDDTYSATLLRGPQGALFCMPGPHRIQLVVSWDDGTTAVSIRRETTVTVTPPTDDDHRVAALIVLATPETLLSLVVSGDHLLRGNAAIDAAVENPVLKPHFALIKARRLASSYYPCKIDKSGQVTWDREAVRLPQPAEALALISEHTVLAPEELCKTARLIDQGIRSAARFAKGDPGRLEARVEGGSNALAAAVLRVSQVLNQRVDRLIKYRILRPKEKIVDAVRNLPQSAKAAWDKFPEHVYKPRH